MLQLISFVVTELSRLFSHRLLAKHFGCWETVCCSLKLAFIMPELERTLQLLLSLMGCMALHNALLSLSRRWLSALRTHAFRELGYCGTGLLWWFIVCLMPQCVWCPSLKRFLLTWYVLHMEKREKLDLAKAARIPSLLKAHSFFC